MKEKTKQKKFNYWPYFAKHKWAIAFDILLHILGIALETFVAIFSAQILLAVTNGTYDVAIRNTLILLTALLILSTSAYIQNILELRTSVKITNAMRLDIAKQAFKVSDVAYANHNTSEFAQRIAHDPEGIFDSLIGITNYITSIIEAVVMVVYISVLNFWIGLITVVGAAIDFAINVWFIQYRKTTLKVSKRYGEKTSSLLVEIIKSNRDIKSLNLESSLKNSLSQKIEAESNYSVKRNTNIQGIKRLRHIFSVLVMCLLVVVGIWLLDLGILTLATFLIIYQNRHEFRALGDMVAAVGDIIAGVKTASERIQELFEDEEYSLEKFGTKSIKNVKGFIEFKNVCFSYDEYRQKTEEELLKEYNLNKKNKVKTKINRKEYVGKKQVLNNINFKIQPNTTVAFVGVSGSGKSTILNLMSKMYEADSGKVLIDNVNIKDLNKKTLRSAISLVNQFPYIFDMSIKDNLLLAKPNATEKEIKKALKDSALDEFVKTLTDKENTVVGESGIKLSGGQKQRLAIARALLKKSPIIFFDESTSSLDNLAQNQVKESIDNIKGKSTIVIVAHRLSTIKNVDKIFFLEHGKIVDEGTFEELFERNEHFKTIFLAENIEK